MNTLVPLKEVVTVSEMARMCGLSRARFYQLINESIFPAPSRNTKTGRPFYDRQQQEQCLLIRRTNSGANGKAVLFYGCRLEARQSPPKRKLFPKRKPSSRREREDPVITELRHGLAQLGVAGMTGTDIRQALSRAYSDGHRDVESAEILRVVFGELQRRDTQDNVAR